MISDLKARPLASGEAARMVGGGQVCLFIARHGGEAAHVRYRFFNELKDQQRRQIIIFLESL